MKNRVTSTMKREAKTAVLMVSPVLVGLIAFYIAPSVWSIVLSFSQGTDYANMQFVGLSNYKTLFLTDPHMKDELLNTAYFASGSVVLGITTSLLLAVALNRKMRMRSVYRVIYFLPSVTMAAAVGVVWRSLLNTKYGAVNQLLGHLGIAGPSWLTDPRFMIPGLIIVSVWSSAGYNMILLLSGLQNIPRTYYEAAQIDGANIYHELRHITLPLLSPILFFVTITSLIGAFKAFDIVYTFSNAAGSAERFFRHYRTMVYGIYQKGFLFNNYGLASAEAVVLLIIILASTAVQFSMQKRMVHYE